MLKVCKLTAIAAVFALLVSASSFFFVFAEEKVALSDGYTYAAVEGGVAIVKYKGDEVNLIIPEKLADKPVVEIRSGAFSDCKKLTNLTIPSGVSQLGGGSIAPALESISVAEGNRSYMSSGGVLFTADALTLVCYPVSKPDSAYTVPDGTQSVLSRAFSGNVRLTSVNLPQSCSIVGSYAFANCTALVTVSLSPLMSTLEEGVFSGCSSLGDMALPDVTAKIGARAFENCTSLVYMGLPRRVIELGKSAFAGCRSLKVLSVSSDLGIGGADSLAAAFTGFTGLSDSFRIYLSDKTECRINSRGIAEYVSAVSATAETTGAASVETAAETIAAQTTAAEVLTLPETETVPEITSDPSPSSPVYDPARLNQQKTAPTLKVVGETTSKAQTAAVTTKPASQTTSQPAPETTGQTETDADITEIAETDAETTTEAAVSAVAEADSFKDDLTLVYVLGAVTFALSVAAAVYIFLKK